MKIHGLNKTTLLDYPGHVAAGQPYLQADVISNARSATTEILCYIRIRSLVYRRKTFSVF